MNRKLSLEIILLVSCLIYIIGNPDLLVKAEEVNEIRISGLVDRPLNLTYADLLSFPMVSEVAFLYCPFDDWGATFNWTGVPLFHLLTLAGVKEEAISVTFRARDDYRANMRIVDVLKPTTILALKGNGTILSEISAREGGFRVVFPCKYGYQWVENIKEIEVIDQQVQSGLDDDMPNCVMPSIDPPLQLFNLTIGKREYQIRVFTNVSITGFNFDHSQKQMYFNISVPAGAIGFTEFVIPQNFFEGPYSVFLNEKSVEFVQANVANLTFIHLLFPKASLALRIFGERLYGLPEIMVEFNQKTYVGETVDFDASNSTDDGSIVSYKWDFGDGIYGNGSVVSHSYSEVGVYQVVLNVTDNEGLSNLGLLTVTVEENLINIGAARLVSAVIICASVSILAVLLLRRKPELYRRLIDRFKTT